MFRDVAPRDFRVVDRDTAPTNGQQTIQDLAACTQGRQRLVRPMDDSQVAALSCLISLNPVLQVVWVQEVDVVEGEAVIRLTPTRRDQVLRSQPGEVLRSNIAGRGESISSGRLQLEPVRTLIHSIRAYAPIRALDFEQPREGCLAGVVLNRACH